MIEEAPILNETIAGGVTMKSFSGKEESPLFRKEFSEGPMCEALNIYETKEGQIAIVYRTNNGDQIYRWLISKNRSSLGEAVGHLHSSHLGKETLNLRFADLIGNKISIEELREALKESTQVMAVADEVKRLIGQL